MWTIGPLQPLPDADSDTIIPMGYFRTVSSRRLPVAACLATAAALAAGCSPGGGPEQSPAALTETLRPTDTVPGAPESPSATTDTSPACRAGDIDGTIDSTQAGAGSSMRTVRLTNTGPACTMYGFPGVSVTDAEGAQLGAAAEREDSSRPESVHLSPGESAHFHMRMSNARMFDPTICKPVDRVAFIRIYPPNDTGYLSLPATGTACSETSTTFLFTGSVHPG